MALLWQTLIACRIHHRVRFLGPPSTRHCGYCFLLEETTTGPGWIWTLSWPAILRREIRRATTTVRWFILSLSIWPEKKATGTIIWSHRVKMGHKGQGQRWCHLKRLANIHSFTVYRSEITGQLKVWVADVQTNRLTRQLPKTAGPLLHDRG